MESKKIFSDEERKAKRKEYSKRYREKNREKVKESLKKYYYKNRDELQKKMREYGKKHYEENKERIIEKNKKYYEENKENMLANGRVWQENNRDKMRGYYKKYDDNNKEKRKEYKNRPEVKKKTRERNKKYDAIRRKDPIFRFNQNISRAINLSLKKHNLSKNGRHWEDLVRYTSQELRDHLESLFQPGMTWENRGSWHIDHILPKSFFEIKEVGDVEFKMCWRLANLQPLWAFDNLSKKDKIIMGRA